MHNTYNLEVGQRIQEARENMHLSREQFCALCGISPGFLSAVERGKKGLTAKSIYKICNAAHLSANYIIMGNHSLTEDSLLQTVLMDLDKREQKHLFQMIYSYVRSVHELQGDQLL